MNENKNYKPLVVEKQIQIILKKSTKNIDNKPLNQELQKTFLFPKQDLQNKNSEETSSNFRRSISLVNLLSNKTHFVDANKFKLMPDVINNGKTTYMSSKDKKGIFKNKNYFYLTSSFNPYFKKKKLKKNNSCQDIYKYNRKNVNNLIDLLHEKEIQLCLELIKKMPENKRIKNNKKEIKNNNKDLKTEDTNHLIRLIKNFNFDNITNQRIIEDKILDSLNYSLNYNFNHDVTPLNTLSKSMSTNYKTNNIHFNNIYNFNSSNATNNINFNSSSVSKNNNSSTMKNNNESNIINNNTININKSIMNGRTMKPRMTKFFNNKFNNNNNIYTKILYDPRNEINFTTGFIRSQKNLYEDVYSKYFKNNKKNDLRVKRYRKKKEEANKISPQEIEEYKSIIKEIENQKNRELRRNKSVLGTNKKTDNVVKDQLLEELNAIYQNQKNTFLDSLKNNFENSERMQRELHKKEVNKNLQIINRIKRVPNTYVDGYSLFDGNINKKLKQYNYILGNKFHDKEQLKEKEDKFNKCVNEYENKIKKYKNDLLNDKNLYKELFKQKIDFNKDENKDKEDDVNYKNENYIFNRKNNNISVGINKKIKKISSKSLSNKNINDDKIYNDYVKFKNEYIKNMI